MPDQSLPVSSGNAGDHGDVTSLREALMAERRRGEQLVLNAQESREALAERLQFEQMLGEICSSLINVDPDKLDRRIDSNLRDIVEFLGVDRSSLCEVSTDDGKVRLTHSWVRPGLRAAELYEPMDSFKFYLDQLRHNHIVVITSVQDLPPEAEYERQYCLSHGLKSHVGVPLIVGGDFLGAIGFAFLQSEHRWSQDMLGRLQLIGEAFANALLRKQWAQDQLDMTRMLERRVAQRTAMVEKKSSQLRRLTLQLTQVARRERRRIAQVLHEGLQQVLVGAKFSLASRICPTLPEDCRDRVFTMLDKAISISRSLAMELCPPILYSLGLVSALRWLGDHMKETYGLHVDVRVDEQAEPASEDLQEFVFEAARHLLFNVLKHAQTNAAIVVYEKVDSKRARLSVVDHGVGFDPASLDDSAGEGFGLLSLSERVELLGGDIAITSAPGQGACIILSLPMNFAGMKQAG